MIKLFISYRSLDSAKVDMLISRLRSLRNEDTAQRYQVWQDKDSIPVGMDWWDAIVNAIIDCQIFVFMVSRESVKNANCRAELGYARRRNRPILPLVLPGEFTYHPVKGKNDIDYWDDVPHELNDLRAQFLFYEGTSFVEQIESAITVFLSEPQRWRDLLNVPRPRDPRDASDESNTAIDLYDEACDYAWRSEFSTAERLFQKLINANDPDFSEDAHAWILILREYQKLVSLDSRQSTRHRVQPQREKYRAMFPKPLIEGVFDPKGLALDPERESATPPTSEALPDIESPAAIAARRVAELMGEESTAVAPTNAETQDPAEIARQMAHKLTAKQLIERQPAEVAARMQATSPPPPSDPVQAAIQRARSFKGKRNADWQPFVTTFPDLPIPDMPFCLVPVGSFMMGSDDGPGDEKPAHPQTIEQPYWIAQYPVTNAQWAAAVRAGVVKEPDDMGDSLKWYRDPKMADASVVGIDWFMARDVAA